MYQKLTIVGDGILNQQGLKRILAGIAWVGQRRAWGDVATPLLVMQRIAAAIEVVRWQLWAE